jgi:hypothetical protein
MRNRREDIEYHNRKFKFVFTGVDADADFRFFLTQPPNEFAFSDRYSQCLIQITRAIVSNRGDTVNSGLDAMFCDPAGAGRERCASGVMLRTDLRSNNKRHYYVDTIDSTDHGIFCILTNKYGTPSEDVNFAGIPHLMGLPTRGRAAGGGGLQGANQNTHFVNTYEFHDTRPIEDAGVLCANPFGKTFSVILKSTDSENKVKMTSEQNFNVAASNGTSLVLEMEILMLPNPTPEDK